MRNSASTGFVRNSATSSSGGYVKFIVYLQVIGIVLVVLGHSFNKYPGGENGTNMLMYRMMFNFRMPLFLFVSGFLLYYASFFRGKVLSPGRFALGKVKRLLIPFVVLTLVTFVPRAAMSSIADDAIEMSVNSFWRSFIFGNELVIPFFWFLQASFILLVINYAGLYFFRNYRNGQQCFILFMLVVLGALPYAGGIPSDFFSIDEVVRLGFYFVLGIAVCIFLRSETIEKIFATPVAAVICAAVWALMFIYGEDTPWERLASVFGIAMCLSVALLLVRYRITVLDHLSGANYIIFLLSWYFNVLFQQVLSHFVLLPWWCYTVMSLFAGIYLPWLIYRYMCRHKERKTVKAAAYLLGQRLR